MSGASFDLNDFDIPRRDKSTPRAEVEHWLQTLESLLSDVADDPELAAPLARVIARTRARHEAATDRTKRTLSSIDSILQRTKRPSTAEPAPVEDDEAESALLSLEAAIRRYELGNGSSDS